MKRTFGWFSRPCSTAPVSSTAPARSLAMVLAGVVGVSALAQAPSATEVNQYLVIGMRPSASGEAVTIGSSQELGANRQTLSGGTPTANPDTSRISPIEPVVTPANIGPALDSPNLRGVFFSDPSAPVSPSKNRWFWDSTPDAHYLPGPFWPGDTSSKLFLSRGVDWSGDMAVTSASGTFSLQNIRLFGQFGIRATSQSAPANVSNSYYYDDPSLTGVLMDSIDDGHPSADAPTKGWDGGYDHTGLLGDLRAWRTFIRDLPRDVFFASGDSSNPRDLVNRNTVNAGGSYTGSSSRFLYDLNSLDPNGDGYAVIDIQFDGTDFEVNNSDWIIYDSDLSNGSPFAIFRLRGRANMNLSNASILVADGVPCDATGLGALFVKAHPEEEFTSTSGSSDTVFSANNLVVNRVGFWDLNTIGDAAGDTDYPKPGDTSAYTGSHGVNLNSDYVNRGQQTSYTKLSVQDGQGCSQFISPFVYFQNVRWTKCVQCVKSLAITATPYCLLDAPWVRYEVTPVGFVPTGGAKLEWIDSDGAVVATLEDQPLSGDVLWPEADIDPATGRGIAWPGWDLNANNEWVQIPTKVRPQATLRVSVNPTAEVIVTYPPATPDCASEPYVSLGNMVFWDTDINGRFNGADTGIDGVTVELWSPGADGVMGGGDDVPVDWDGVTPGVQSTIITSGGGWYLFARIPSGRYYTRIPSTQFGPGGAIEGFLSSPGAGADETTDQDRDENGWDTSDPAVDGVVSGVVNLQAQFQPTGEVGPQTGVGDNSENLTLDFGFYPASADPVAHISGSVYDDLTATPDRNKDAPIAGVTIKLYTDTDGDGFPDDYGAPDRTTTTDGDGYYEFLDVPIGPSYAILEEDPADYLSTYDVFATWTDNLIALTVDGPGIYAKNDFWDYRPGGSGDPSTSVGSLVWMDRDDDGAYDADTENGIDGVNLRLWQVVGGVRQDADGNPANGDTPFLGTTTGGGGLYFFSGLPPGQYQIEIPASNFADGKPLAGSRQTGGTPDPDDNQQDNDNNGLQAGGAGTVIYSPVIDLGDNTEPVDGAGATDESGPGAGQDNAEDNNGDQTVDFGFAPNPPTAAQLGCFRAMRTENGVVQLSWSTLNESDLIGFRIERIGASGEWTVAGMALIPAQGGDYQPQAYTQADASFPGAIRYRLVAVDLRGRAKVLAEASLGQPAELRIEVLGAELHIKLRGQPGGEVVLESASDAERGGWGSVQNLRLDSTGQASVSQPLESGEGMRFYRVRE